MANATSSVRPLRRRMIDDMTLRNLSLATQRSYLNAVSKFSRHFYLKLACKRLRARHPRVAVVWAWPRFGAMPGQGRTSTRAREWTGKPKGRAVRPALGV